MSDALTQFQEMLVSNREHGTGGICSVCSAHAEVIKASMEQAVEDDSIVLIEATSNQVNQFGGYTGMQAADFVEYVNKLADEVGFPRERVLLGGDHLGPNSWQNEPAAEAMDKAEVLIRSYVAAGFRKIHLDCSMFCADDEGDRHAALSDSIVGSRAARLCAASEEQWAETDGKGAKPLYILGTEVPVPGGAQEEEDIVIPTTPEDANMTIVVTKACFEEAGLAHVWDRVIALVVQPGVEFGDDQIFDYAPEAAASLSKSILAHSGMVYEAHSTDYQREEGLAELVRDHFCILKVGPWLTYAYREAIYLLADVEKELIPDTSELSRVKEVIEEVMLAKPGNWQKYYKGTEQEITYKRKYSFSDRSRYYWPDADIQAAIAKLNANLRKNGIPFSLLSQYFPVEFTMIRDGKLANDPVAIARQRVRQVVSIYSRASGIA